MKANSTNNVILIILFLITPTTIAAQEKAADDQSVSVADKLSNPIANMISVPFQHNADYGIGHYNGSKYQMNFQPVIPFALNKKLNLVTRLIIPVVDQRDIFADRTAEFGLSDATISFFFSPSTPKKSGIVWGVGPAFLIPIGTDDLLSTRKWAAGPTLLILRQANGLTYGILTNQLWSFAGDDNRSDVNQLFFQPFFAKNWKSGAGVTLNSEMTFNWETNTTSISLNPLASAVTKIGNQVVQLGVGPRIPIGGSEESRPDFGLRAVFTLVFPEGA